MADKLYPTVSVTLKGKDKDSNGRTLVVTVSLTGETLRLRGGILNNVSVDVNELRDAIAMLEKHSQSLEE